jgi:toxin ParE1/3/4
MRIVFRPQARTDLRNIFAYLVERSPSAAVRIRETIQEQSRTLVDHPELGCPGRVPETRELVITHTSYIVQYIVNRPCNTIYVLRVVHGAQECPTDLESET